ncbi:MAG: cell division protein FtsQ [Gallionellales bacterium RIFCSPLOWO2_02_FULL_57_47]|nr:MAG: cell division protein FtsQ [Gallionellales bacterium RIFCSPLOWO2_02_FULL_57_47]OGT13397.1 MAG: cell division protein FtsQ [Gallionellales bacterium RIFCSPHIGHO2_02_FULL_57_16]
MWNNALLIRNTANALIIFSVLAMLYGAAWYVMHLPGLLPLQSVRLSAPPQRVSAAELLRVMRSEVRGNLFTVNIERLRQSFEKLPWVRSVSIRREFPHRLAVQLEEHQAMARWNNSALVNQQGETFVAGSDQALPGFIGQEGTSAEIAQHYARFNQQLVALGLTVEQVALSPRHAWQLRLNNGMVLELGREDMQQRLARFVAVQRTEDRRQMTEDRNTVKYVDLRYRNGFAVRRATNDKG